MRKLLSFTRARGRCERTCKCEYIL